jgi:hypothetical protein
MKEKTTTLSTGEVIISSFEAYSFYARCGDIREGGYYDERKAINAVKRRLIVRRHARGNSLTWGAR